MATIRLSSARATRGRFREVSRHQFYDHQDMRQFMIKAALTGLDLPIVVIGNSITEMARLPEVIDDKPVVNAGIGGASIEDFEALAPRLLQGLTPSIIVVALRTSDDTAMSRHYATLLSILKAFSPRILAVAAPQDGEALEKYPNQRRRDSRRSAGVRRIISDRPSSSKRCGISRLDAGACERDISGDQLDNSDDVVAENGGLQLRKRSACTALCVAGE